MGPKIGEIEPQGDHARDAYERGLLDEMEEYEDYDY